MKWSEMSMSVNDFAVKILKSGFLFVCLLSIETKLTFPHSSVLNDM